MKVAFELPYKHIKKLKNYQDYNFLLAHKVLDDPQYRADYGVGAGVLDNSQYELGEPLEIRQLHMATRLCQPDVVIAPDWLGDREKTVRSYKEASALIEGEVAGVVQGENTLDMLKCYGELLKQGCVFICLPFRLNRVELMELVVQQNLMSPNVWYHFLGLKSLKELRAILALGLGPNTSIDTSKPIKAALYNKSMYDNLRNHNIDWDRQLSPDEEQTVIEYMQAFTSIVLRGGSD